MAISFILKTLFLLKPNYKLIKLKTKNPKLFKMRYLVLLTIFSFLFAHIASMSLDAKSRGCACTSEDINGNCLQWVCGKRELEKGCACTSEDTHGNCLQWVCGKRDIEKGCACTSEDTHGNCLQWVCGKRDIEK